MTRTAPDEARFRAAMSLLATGVTVITTDTDDGPAGMTASAVCSLSVEPLQVLVCVSSALPTHAALDRSGSFAINVLGEDQAWLARRFATPGIDRFSGVALREQCHLPVLRDAIAYFACTVHERLPGGDHSIFIGQIEDCGHVPSGRPLLYFDRAFGTLESPEALMLRTWVEGGATT